MQDKKVNILGSEYTIKYDVPDEQMPEGSDGIMDYSIKQLKLQNWYKRKIQ